MSAREVRYWTHLGEESGGAGEGFGGGAVVEGGEDNDEGAAG